MSVVSCSLGGNSVDIFWVSSHFWEWALSRSRMGLAGMTKLFLLGFSHPSSRKAKIYSHDSQTWLILRLKVGILSLLLYCPGQTKSQHWPRFEEQAKFPLLDGRRCKVTLQRVWIQGEVENWGRFCILSTTLLYLNFLIKHSQELINI